MATGQFSVCLLTGPSAPSAPTSPCLHSEGHTLFWLLSVSLPPYLTSAAAPAQTLCKRPPGFGPLVGLFLGVWFCPSHSHTDAWAAPLTPGLHGQPCAVPPEAASALILISTEPWAHLTSLLGFLRAPQLSTSKTCPSPLLTKLLLRISSLSAVATLQQPTSKAWAILDPLPPLSTPLSYPPPRTVCSATWVCPRSPCPCSTLAPSLHLLPGLPAQHPYWPSASPPIDPLDQHCQFSHLPFQRDGNWPYVAAEPVKCGTQF